MGFEFPKQNKNAKALCGSNANLIFAARNFSAFAATEISV